jgi:hypothetical protein
MPQYVPAFEWTDDALVVRQFLFDFWARTGRAPNLRQLHEGTGIARRAIVQALKLLELGIVIVVDRESPNCDVLKAPPFSAFPSQVELYMDDRFHTFVGCAHEAIGVGNMPQFRDIGLRLESYCACCLQPITLWSRNFEVTRTEPANPLIHCATTPWDWVNTDMKSMCDNVNFVFDADHALRYERMIGRRGVLFTIPQVHEYVSHVAHARGHDYHWPPLRMDPEAIVDRMRDLGVDLSPWGL